MTDRDPDMMAAELALGLLDGDERAAALRRVLSEPRFAAEVEWWRRHFAELLADYPSVAAPSGIVERIVAPPAPRTRGRIWWIASALVAVAAAIMLMIVQRPGPTPIPATPERSPALMIAALSPGDKTVAPIGATVNSDTGEIRIAANPLAPKGKTAELWVIQDGVPHSLGLLKPVGATRLALSAGQRAYMRTDATLAISIEPPGGSPAATPTGPVVATGTLAAT